MFTSKKKKKGKSRQAREKIIDECCNKHQTHGPRREK